MADSKILGLRFVVVVVSVFPCIVALIWYYESSHLKEFF
jgi:hypothetical protein